MRTGRARGTGVPTTGALPRRYAFKLYPSRAQAEALDRQRRMHCALYNAALQERADHYRHQVQRVGKETARGLSCYDQQRSITLIRAADPEWAALSSASMQATLERVDRALKGFVRRAGAGAGARSGYPRFQSADRFAGFGFKKHGNGWRLDVGPGKSHRLYLKGTCGLVKARGKFPAAPERIKTLDMMFRNGGWWASVVVEMAPRLRAEHRDCGEIDFDLVDHFAVVKTADGGCGAVPLIPQDAARPYLPTLDTDRDGWIDWTWSPEDAALAVRAFGWPYAGASAVLDGHHVRIARCLVPKAAGLATHPLANGTVLASLKGHGVNVACGGRVLRVGTFRHGGDEVPAGDFARAGMRFQSRDAASL